MAKKAKSNKRRYWFMIGFLGAVAPVAVPMYMLLHRKKKRHSKA